MNVPQHKHIDFSLDFSYAIGMERFKQLKWSWHKHDEEKNHPPRIFNFDTIRDGDVLTRTLNEIHKCVLTHEDEYRPFKTAEVASSSIDSSVFDLKDPRKNPSKILPPSSQLIRDHSYSSELNQHEQNLILKSLTSDRIVYNPKLLTRKSHGRNIAQGSNKQVMSSELIAKQKAEVVQFNKCAEIYFYRHVNELNNLLDDGMRSFLINHWKELEAFEDDCKFQVITMLLRDQGCDVEVEVELTKEKNWECKPELYVISRDEFPSLDRISEEDLRFYCKLKKSKVNERTLESQNDILSSLKETGKAYDLLKNENDSRFSSEASPTLVPPVIISIDDYLHLEVSKSVTCVPDDESSRNGFDVALTLNLLSKLFTDTDEFSVRFEKQETSSIFSNPLPSKPVQIAHALEEILLISLHQTTEWINLNSYFNALPSSEIQDHQKEKDVSNETEKNSSPPNVNKAAVPMNKISERFNEASDKTPTSFNYRLKSINVLTEKMYQKYKQTAGINEMSRVWKISKDSQSIAVMIKQPDIFFTKTDDESLSPVNISIKLEYQTKFGAEAMTRDELLREWCALRFSKNPIMFRYRVDVMSLKILSITQISIENVETELSEKHSTNPQMLLGSVYNIFSCMKRLPQGNYAIQTKIEDSCKKLYIYKASETGKYLTEDPWDVATISSRKWLRIDETTPTFLHFNHHFAPGCFPLKSKRLSSYISMPRANQKKTTKVKKKIPKRLTNSPKKSPQAKIANLGKKSPQKKTCNRIAKRKRKATIQNKGTIK